MATLFSLTAAALATADIDAELTAVDDLVAAWRGGDLALGADEPVLAVTARRTPERPVLVPPRRVATRGVGTPEGRGAAVHAVAHIEANAVDLALDAAHRFRGLPRAYYDDWLSVAAEEAAHFRLLAGRLAAYGLRYGDLPAHAGLWDPCVASADDPLRRMALVPRVFEARGLDANPPLVAKFTQAGDLETAAVLRRILDDEVGHVAVGDRWFRHLCAERGLDPESTFAAVVDSAGLRVRPPLNEAARLAAGFSPGELRRFAAGSPRTAPRA